jgi:hypothetical protein
MTTINLIAPCPELTLQINCEPKKSSILDTICFNYVIIEEDRIFMKQSLQNLIKTNNKMNTFFEKHTGIYIQKGFDKSYTEKKYFNITLYDRNTNVNTKRKFHCYYNDDGIYDITTVSSIMFEDFKRC